jgi:hypothetical protein
MLLNVARTRTAPFPFSIISSGITSGSIGGTESSGIPGQTNVSCEIVTTARHDNRLAH